MQIGNSFESLEGQLKVTSIDYLEDACSTLKIS